jgi:hypothetical protein
MRSSFVFLVVVLFLGGCSPMGKIQVSYDTIRDMTIADLHTSYESVEIQSCEGCEDPYTLEVWYVREFDGGDPRPVEMTIWVEDAQLDGAEFQNQGFMRIGVKPYRLDMRTLEGEDRAQIGKRKGQGTGGMLAFTPELEVGVLRAQKITLRVIAGQQPLTIQLEGESLRQLREFIETVPLHKSQRM